MRPITLETEGGSWTAVNYMVATKEFQQAMNKPGDGVQMQLEFRANPSVQVSIIEFEGRREN